jgi:hypothetical protein
LSSEATLEVVDLTKPDVECVQPGITSAWLAIHFPAESEFFANVFRELSNDIHSFDEIVTGEHPLCYRHAKELWEFYDHLVKEFAAMYKK